MKSLGLVLLAVFACASAEASQYLIKFKPGIEAAGGVRELEEAGFVYERHLAEISLYVASPVPGTDESAALKRLRQSKRLAYVERNAIKWFASAIPNDALYSGQTDLKRIGAEQAWDLSVGSPEVIVAVTDTGMSFDHPDLRNQVWRNLGEIPANGIDDDGNGYVDDVRGWDFSGKDNDPTDGNGHGTHVAGIIGAEGNNGVGVAGVNWRVSIMAVQFLSASGSGSTLDGVDAVLYAANNGARIINASWGGGGASNALRDAIAYARDKGVLMVCAAGNDATDTDSRANYPSGYEVSNIVAVAATDSAARLASFSNFGRLTVDLAAPGVSILSSFLNNDWKRLSGTSMATPMVVGAAALTLARAGALSLFDLRNALYNSVKPQSALAGRVATEGEVDVHAALTQLEGGFQVWPKHITLKAGDKFQFTAYQAPGALTWSVSDAAIASVSAAGELSALKAGSVSVTARSAAGVSASTGTIVVRGRPRTGD